MDTIYKMRNPIRLSAQETREWRVNSSSRKEQKYAGSQWQEKPPKTSTSHQDTRHCVRITASCLNIRKGPGTNYSILGQLKKNTTIDYFEDTGTWLKIEYLGQDGYICKKYTTPVLDAPSGNQSKNSKGQQAVALARQYLGETTRDLLGKLKYLKDLSSRPNTNNGYNLNCANFVSAVLNEVGLLNQHVVGCAKLREACKSFGYKIVPHKSAQPGDVWINSGHTELVDSIDNGQITLIGSNNNGDKIQEITLDTHSAQTGGDIYAYR